MLRLEMLPAEEGDCLWIEYGSSDRRRAMVVDGGPGRTYERALRPRLEEFARLCARRGIRVPRLELVVVTHIDNDHILGMLDFARDESLPIDIGDIWFNGWDQIAPPDQLGVKEAAQLSKVIETRKLPLNKAFGGRAVKLDPHNPERRHTLDGGLSVTVLSPGEAQLSRLRSKWEKVIAEAGSREAPSDLLGTTAPDVEHLAAKAFKGDAAPANGSSIAILIEYANHRVLLAADSFAPVVEKSLRMLGFKEDNRLPLAAYKVAHHGSRGNNSGGLFGLVRCSNYLFSTNGAAPSHHPHGECVARILKYGRDGDNRITLHSNYRRRDEVLWRSPGIAKKYNFRVLEPTSKGEFLAIDIA